MSHNGGAPGVRSWERPVCLSCESDVFVDANNLAAGTYYCNACEEGFES